MLGRLKIVAAVIALAVAYCWLTFFVFQSTRIALPPSWWGGGILTPCTRVLTWFGMQDVVFSLVCAVPIALLLVWIIDRNTFRLALAVAAPTVLLGLFQDYSEYDWVHWKMYMWISGVVVPLLALLLAVPLLVFLADKVNKRAAVRRLAGTA
jgi:hypothetical protein